MEIQISFNENGNEKLSESRTLLLFIFSRTSNGNTRQHSDGNITYISMEIQISLNENGNEKLSESRTLLLFIFSRTSMKIQDNIWMEL